MTISDNRRTELLERAIRECSSENPVRKMFWSGIHDELERISIDEDFGEEYEAGRKLIKQLMECEPVTSLSATICDPRTLREICSYFGR